MASKEVRFDFFVLKTKNAKSDIFDQHLQKEALLANKTEVDVFGYTLRIGSIRKCRRNLSLSTDKNNYLWIVAIERINLKDEAYVGKKGKTGRDIYAASPDEGPLNDTVFLYDPKTGVIIIQRARGGVNQSGMVSFITNLCNIQDVELELMIDPKILDKLDKLPLVKSIEYSIAIPTKLKSLKSDDRGILGDIKLAKLLGGESLKVVIGADKDEYLERKSTVQKVKTILKSNKSISKMKVHGYNNEDYEILDLVNKRIEYSETINAGRGKKVSYIHIMDTIENAFRAKETLITDYTK